MSWDAVPLTTTFVSSGSLTADVPASLITAVGSPSIVVTNPGEESSNAVSFSIVNTPAVPTLTYGNVSYTWDTATGLLAGSSLSVQGTGLQQGMTLSWNGTNLGPVDSNVSVAVPLSLVRTPGPVSIVAKNPGGAMSGALNLTVPPLRTLTSITPNSVPAGSPSFTLTVNGSGFAAGDTISVWPGGFGLAAQFISSTQLQATVPMSFITANGTLQVWVNTFTASGSFSSINELPLTVGTGVPVLSIAKTHTGNFAQGQQNALYTATVSNASSVPTSGTVTVTESVPAGLALVSMSGTGWTCGGNSCTRSNALAGGATYPPITIAVNVSFAAPTVVINSVGISGGGSLSGSGSDPTMVAITVTVVTTVSVSPNSGSGAGPQVFNATYSDSNGASDLQAVYLDFGSVGDAAHDCKVGFAQGANALYLFNDANNGALGPITLGSGGSLSNSQCTLFGGNTMATPSGNMLTVPFTIQFLAGYGGLKNVFGVAQSYNGTMSSNGAFTTLGTWTPRASTPGVVSVTPNAGSGTGPQVFTAVYSDTGGANDLQAVYLDFGSVGLAASNCIAVYVPGPNTLYLFTDDNSGAVGPIAEGAGGGSISNSQCTLSSGNTPATLSGNNLTVPFNITFKNGYGGKKTIFALAQTYAGVQSTGGVLTNLGTWEPSLTTPSVMSVTPSTGSGLGPTTFTAIYSDTGGANDLQVVYLSFGSAFLSTHSCNVGFQPGNNQLILFSDDNSTYATLGENGPGSVSNSQCTLSGGNTAAAISGTNATVPFTITFNAGFAGMKSISGLAQTYDGTQSGITVLGTWTP